MNQVLMKKLKIRQTGYIVANFSFNNELQSMHKNQVWTLIERTD